MIMSSKESSLHQRLDDLENELKELHERILKKRPVFNQKNLFSRPKVISKQTVKEKRIQFLTDKNEEYWNGIPDLRDNTRGKGPNGNTASLTEITSLSSGLQKALRSIKKKQNEANNQLGLQVGKKVFQKKKSKFVQNNEMSKDVCKIWSYALEDKPLKIEMKGTSSDVTDIPPSKQISKRDTTSNFESMDREIEDRMLDLKLLKERIESVKKKLRDERTRREIAERAIVGYRRRLAILEGKIVKKEEKQDIEDTSEGRKNDVALVDFVASLQKQLQEGYFLNQKVDTGGDEVTKKTLASLEKELNEERSIRLEAEKMVAELKHSLEESQKTVIKLEEGRKLAVAMADQFRDKAEKNDSQEIKKLKAEKEALETELKHKQESKEVSSDIVKKLVERAERAEKELIDKMKQCNDFITKSSLNDPKVVKLIEKHKKAYAELQLEKRNRETELKNRHKRLLKDLEAATVTADKRLEEISDKYNLAVLDLKKKESVINKIKNEKNIMESELRNLKTELQEVAKTKQQQEEQIRSLMDAVKCNDEKIEKNKAENQGSKELYASLEAKYNKLLNSVAEQDTIIEKLRVELEQEKDFVKIKNKMLQDQTDTIKCLRLVADNTKKSLDEERIVKHQLMDNIDKLEISREKLHSKLSNMEHKLKEVQENKIKEEIFLKQLEQKVHQKHVEWEQQIIQVSCEKEKAIQTARFATEKLVKAVNDYENKLNNQKKIQGLLNSALKEKDYQLNIAKIQVQELNEEVWKSAKITERVRHELQTKLKKACEVCTDVIDTQIGLTT